MQTLTVTIVAKLFDIILISHIFNTLSNPTLFWKIKFYFNKYVIKFKHIKHSFKEQLTNKNVCLLI